MVFRHLRAPVGGIGAVLYLLAASTFAVGCGPWGERGEASWQGAVDTLEGRVVVRNTGAPLLSESDVRTRELWSLPLAWSEDARHLWEPSVQVRVSDASVYLLDPVHQHLELRAARDGELERSVHLSAGEAGEALVGVHALAVSDESVIVADSFTIAVFDRELRPVGRFSPGRRVLGLYGTGGGRFLAFTYGGTGARWLSYRGADSAGRSHPPPITRSETHPEAARSECWKPEGYGGGLWLVSCAHPVLVRFDDGGELRREVSFDRPPRAPGEDEVEAVRAAARRRAKVRRPDLGREIVDRLVAREVRRHPFVKKHRAVRYDTATGRMAVLEQTPDYMGGGTATVQVFTEEGVHLAELTFGRKWLDFEMIDGVLYAVSLGEESSVPSLTAHRLELRAPSSGVTPFPSGVRP